MTDLTPRLALPLLASGQAQKELFHNEALALLDALVLPVFAPPQNDPPASPAIGSGWIVGTAPDGDWSGQADALALFGEGGWRFLAPQPGSQLTLTDGRPAIWSGTAWILGRIAGDRLMVGGLQVGAAQRPAIADPAGGAVIDAEVRAALANLLSALRFHGLIAT